MHPDPPTATAPNPYDLIPYESQPITFTGPEHMAVSALLQGGPRPPVERFRYLEIGCADGGNLLPLAFHHPESFFVGVDSSAAEVEAARMGAATIGIANVRFEVADVRALPDLGGPFDYIAVHGVYSWVPEDAREAILACCRERLTLDGLAYISYNVCPGWKVRGVVRDIAVTAAAGESDPRRRLALARMAAQRLVEVLPEDNSGAAPWPRLLRRELEKFLSSRAAYVVHEYLAEDNQPFYFHEFVAGAEAHGLAYVGDADIGQRVNFRVFLYWFFCFFFDRFLFGHWLNGNFGLFFFRFLNFLGFLSFLRFLGFFGIDFFRFLFFGIR